MFTVANRYHVVRSLGSGGMGAVYEAVHSGTGRRVAVKLLHHDSADRTTDRERFVREARLAGALTSPHVVQVFDAGTDEISGLPYIVMELVDGSNLHDLLERRSPLPPGLVLVIAAHVARALAEAHEADVIHRDVKPANVMLTRDAEGKLLGKLVDFGVARSVAGDTVTTTGGFIGSLPYMSPEQMIGRPLDPTTDLWSLGALMYEALSGRRAAGDTGVAIGELVQRVCHEDPPRLTEIAPWVPRGVAQIVHTAMRRERERRFPSARAMEHAIAALLPAGIAVDASALEDGSDIVVVEPAESDGASATRRGRRLWVSAVGLTAVVAAFGIAAGVNRLARADARHPQDGPLEGRPATEPPAIGAIATAIEAPATGASAPATGSSAVAPAADEPRSVEASTEAEEAEDESPVVPAAAEDRRNAPPRGATPGSKKRTHKLSPTADGSPTTLARDPLDHM